MSTMPFSVAVAVPHWRQWRPRRQMPDVGLSLLHHPSYQRLERPKYFWQVRNLPLLHVPHVGV
jgi:hypothetical protein